MDIETILNKKPEERTPEEYQYLEEHSDELTPEQLQQLDNEEVDELDEPVEPVIEEPKADEPKEPEVIPEEPKEPDEEENEEENEENEEDDEDDEDDEEVFEEPKVDSLIAKNVGKVISRNFEVTVKDLGRGVLEAIVSSEALDRHGEKIDMKGMDTKEYMKNPIIAYFHNYDEPSIGKTTKLTKTPDGKMIAKMEFAIDVYEKARLMYDLYKGGFQKAFSIGFIAHEVDGNTYTKSTMLEYSTVLVPANAEALLLAKAKGIDTSILLKDNNSMTLELEKIVEKNIEDLTLGEVKFLKDNSTKLSEAQKEKFASVLEDSVTKQVDEKLEALKKELDPVKVKDINMKQDPNIEIKDRVAPKEEVFKSYVKGLVTRDFSEYKTKSGMDTTDTSTVLPPTDFISAVERLEESYGAARQGGVDIRTTDRSSITMLMGDDDLEIFDTAEGVAKSSTKLSYSPFQLTFRKFAGILPITDELLEESAVNLWNDATNRFARAYTRKEDQLVFTETQGAGKNPGIIHQSGVNYIDIGSSLSQLTLDHLNQAIYGVPTPSAVNGKFFFNKKVLGFLQTIKDPTTSQYIWKQGAIDGAAPTVWGKQYVLTDVLPEDQDAGTDFIVFGDLRYSTLGMRTGLNIKIFDAGAVGDPEGDVDGNDLNLLTMDLQAMRAVKRFNAKVRFPSAFSVIGVRADAS